MSTITLQNFRVGSDLTVKVRLKDGGVAIDWSTLSGIRAVLYSDAQSSIAGRCDVTVDGEDPTLLVCRYAATKMQYLGVNRIVVSAKYMGMTKTYDKPAFTFVRWTEDQAGEEITIEDPEVTVEIDVEDVSSSILQEAVDAAFSAADRANEAAEAAEHMVDIHTGPEGKSAYEVAVEEGYTGTEEEWLASLKGPVGETPDISIGTVTTVEPGTPAAASMGGTPEAPVLNLSIPKGLVGATPNFTVGTVTTGQPGSSVIVTITGTPEAPVLNLTIPQGMQGNTGSSVEYPYELVNNLTTDDATKGLSAAQGKVLDGKVSQLEAEVNDLNSTRYEEDNINISSRQQFILGYATKQGVFTDIGTGTGGLRYVAVESGKTYRMTGKYTGNATGKANLMFSANIPANDGVAVVITSERGVNEDFNVTYTPESDGYICLYVASIDYCGNFFLYSKELITDSLKEKDEELESAISEKSVGGISFSFLTGNVNNRGVCKNIGASVNYGFNYIPVTKGRKYTISGTYSNNAGTYAGMVFSETMLATNAVAVIVEMGTSGGTINKTYIPQLDGYLFAFSSNATFTEEKSEGKYLPKDSVFSYCKQMPLKLVGVADSKKYVTTRDNKITEGTADRTFMIQVLAGEKYLVRGRTHAYSQYAVIAFAQSNAVGTVAQIILSVNSEQLDFDFNQVVSIPANGYLIVWSSVCVYGSSNYTEILPLLDRITIDNDYYLPESFKLQTFGDSITDSSWGDSSSWVSYVPDNIPIQGLTIVNSGIGGYTYTGLRNLMENGGENSGGGVAPALQDDADLVTIFLGTNDWSSGLTIDAVKTNIRNALDYLFATCKAKVLVMTPLQRYTSADAQRETDENGIPLNSAGYTLRELCDMIVDVCGMYSVPVLDLNAVALINKFNIMDYSEDGLHPNRWGDILVSRLICKKIKEMLRG